MIIADVPTCNWNHTNRTFLRRVDSKNRHAFFIGVGMARKRTSKVWGIPLAELKKIVANAQSVSEVLRCCGLINKGHNYKTLKQRLDEEKIDYSHIPKGIGWRKGKKGSLQKTRPLEDYLIENGKYTDRAQIKKRLIQEEVIPYKCTICDQPPMWQGNPLTLVLDHINGVSTDHRLENLRFLCPHCDSQQLTFAGRNTEAEAQKFHCEKCEVEISRGTKTGLCVACERRSRRIVVLPSVEILLREVEENGYEAVGRKYGVTNTAIRRRIKTDAL